MISNLMNEFLKMHLPVSENLFWNQQQPFLKAESHPHLPIFKQKSACKVLLYNSNQQYLGLGIFSPERMQISFVCDVAPEMLVNYFSQHLSEQLLQRKRTDTNSIRLIHHQKDGLPGVCIDLIDQTAVIQTSESGADLLIDDLVMALLQVPAVTSVYLKNTQRMRSKLQLVLQEHWLTANNPSSVLHIHEDNHTYEYDIENQKQLFPLHLRAIRKWVREKLCTNETAQKKILLINFEDNEIRPKQHRQHFSVEVLNTARMPFTEITAQLRNYTNQNLDFDAILMKTFDVNSTPQNITALHHFLHALCKLKSQPQAPVLLTGVGYKTAWHQLTRQSHSPGYPKPKHLEFSESDFPQLRLFQIQL